MSTLPLEVHEVLEEEYEAIHRPLGERDCLYQQDDILDEACARRILDKWGGGSGTSLCDRLNALVEGETSALQQLRNSPAITETGRQLLDDAAVYADEDRRKFNRRVLDEALRGSMRPLRDARLAQLYGTLHDFPDDDARTALCISGGGI